MDYIAIAALITAIGGIVTTLVTNNVRNAVLECKIEELTREVRLHNNFATRVPVLEEKVNNLESSVDDK